MKQFKSQAVAALSIVVLCLVGGVAFAQEGHGHDHGEGGHGHADPHGGMDPAAMQKMMELGMPGEHHDHIAKLAGDWKAEATFWQAPGAPAMTISGTMKNEMLLNGRFLRSNWSGDFMGQTMHGIGVDGYDNLKQKHIGTWMDSMSTMMMTFEGTCAEGGKVTTTEGKFLDPMTGKMKMVKGVTTFHGKNKYTYESWEKVEGGDPHKNMEIVFTR